MQNMAYLVSLTLFVVIFLGLTFPVMVVADRLAEKLAEHLKEEGVDNEY